MRFQQAPYRIADVVALLFILHGNTSFGSLAPIIPYRSCKHYLAYAEKKSLPLPLIGQRREDYISNILGQIFPKCSTMQLRTSDAFWLPVSAPVAMVPFDGSQYENRDSCCYLLNPSHLENHSFKGQIPFDDFFCGQDLTKVYVSDDPSGQGNEINLRYKNLLDSPSNGEEEFQAGKQLKVFFKTV